MTTDPFAIDKSPTTEPDAMVIGSFVQWRRLFDYPSSTYTLRYDVHNGGQGHNVTFNGTYDATNEWWAFSVGSADYGNVDAGLHHWDLVLTRTSDGEEVFLEHGALLFFASTGDRRTHAEIMVAKIESVMEGRADHDIESYSIKNRSLTRMSVKELMQWREYYLDEIARTGGSTTAGKTGPSKNTLRVRFV